MPSPGRRQAAEFKELCCFLLQFQKGTGSHVDQEVVPLRNPRGPTVSANRSCYDVAVSLEQDLENALNPVQREAVFHVEGPLLILAGAGSGKTRILTYRMAHLVSAGHAFPGEIFAVTFTNKAAKEMQERVHKLLGPSGIPLDQLWISTFHSSGAKLLRLYGSRLGLQPGFSIFDDSDQQSLIKSVMAKLEISDKVIAPKAISAKINSLKNDGINPKDYQPKVPNFFDNKLIPILKGYQSSLEGNNAVDFGDLILKSYELMRDHLDIRDRFQDQYRFVLVDEYQDTNAVQYKLLRLITEKHRNICVVGDEDQSIYKWRGADIRNILEFEKDFPDAKICKLEENYRSTASIIRSASTVIANNSLRKDKTLFTNNPEGTPVEVHLVESDFEESRFVVRNIQVLLNSDVSPRQIAIFYRTNAQSRLFEDMLRQSRIEYRVFGGLRFYDRAEIKDVIAYMRLFVNPRDNVSLARIINTPVRGIGKTTIDQIRDYASREGMPMIEAVGLAAKGEAEGVPPAARKKLSTFLSLYEKLTSLYQKCTPFDFFSALIQETGYVKALELEGEVESAARIENIKELGSAIQEFEQRTPEATLEGFIQEVALVSEVEKDQRSEDYVTLMTMHSAKGLEFPVVFIGGFEEELFPSIKQGETNEDEAVEEERRLAYVGMTRARERLFLLSAKRRRIFGVTHNRAPSRFLNELPKEGVLVQDHAPGLSTRRQFQDDDGFDSGWGSSGPVKSRSPSNWDDYSQETPKSEFADFLASDPSSDTRFQVGSRVRHPDYGEGQVMGREGRGDSLKVSIKFAAHGLKKFVVKFAPLEPVS